MLGLAAESARDEAAARRQREGDRIEHALQVAERRRLGLHPRLAGGGDLAGRQPVDLVVHHDVRDVDVAAHRLDEVVQPDAVAVAVAAGRDDGHRRVGQLGARGERQRPPVQAVHAVRPEEPGQVRRAADARNDQHLGRIQPEAGARLEQAVQHAEVAAAGTPVGRDFRLEHLGFYCNCCHCHRYLSPLPRTRPG